MNNQARLNILLFAIAIQLSLPASCFAATTQPGEDWPKLLGPQADGTSRETNLLTRWKTNGPPILWSKAVGTGYSAPSILGSKLVLHHRLGNEEVIECMDAISGQSLWTRKYPSKFADPYGYNNGPRACPVLSSSNLCYTFGAEGKLLCVALDSGRLVWERDTAKDWKVPEAFFGVGSTPWLEGNTLIVMVGGQPNSGLVGLDAKTGATLWENVGASNWEGQPMIGWPGERQVVWRAWDKQASYSSPMVVPLHGKPTLLCLMRQGLVSLDPSSGKVNFSRFFMATVNESVNAANPVVVDDMVFISAAYYKVGSVVLKVKPDGKSFEEVWRGTSMETHWSTPVYHQGYLYGFSGRNEPDANMRCIEFTTGKLMWSRDERWRPHSATQPPVYGRGSVIKADDKLIALGEGGLLGVFRLNPQKDEEIARFQIPDLQYPTWAAPVLSRKRLYLRSEKQLVCIDLAMK